MPLTVTGTVSLSQAEDNLRDLVAACDHFKRWTGSTTAAEAKDHVHVTLLDREIDADHELTAAEQEHERPFALIDTETEEGHEYTKVAEGLHTTSGNLVLQFEDNLDEAVGLVDAVRKFKEDIGTVIQEMIDLVDEVGSVYLRITRIVLTVSPKLSDRSERNSRGRFIFAEYAIRWHQAGGE